MVDSTQLLAEASSLRDTKGNLNGALEKIEAILAFDPKDPAVWIQKAIIERDGGDLEQAEISLRKALEQCSDDDYVRLATAKRLYAGVLLIKQDIEKAHTIATEAVHIARLSENKDVLSLCICTLARVLFTMKAYQEAATQAQLAVDMAESVHFTEGELRSLLVQAQIELARQSEDIATVKQIESVIDRAHERLLAIWFEALSVRSFCSTPCDAEHVRKLQKAYKITANNGWALAQAQLAHALGVVLESSKPETAATYFKTAAHLYSQIQTVIPDAVTKYIDT